MPLIFAETTGEAASAPRDAIRIAAGPEAELEFERRGLSFHPLSEFVADDEVEAWGHELFSVADELAAAIDRSARTVLDEDIAIEPGIGTAQWYQLKIMLDALTLRARIASRVLESLRPNSVLVYRRERSARDMAGLEGSLWFSLLP